MGDHVLSQAELMVMALAQADAGEFLAGKNSWHETRNYLCPNCGWIKGTGVRQAERDEVSLYVCRACDEIAEEQRFF